MILLSQQTVIPHYGMDAAFAPKCTEKMGLLCADFQSLKKSKHQQKYWGKIKNGKPMGHSQSIITLEYVYLKI